MPDTTARNASPEPPSSCPEIAELERCRRDVVVLFTNIKGSVPYFARFGDAAGTAMVRTTNKALADVILDYGGQVIKTMGDSLLAIFDLSRAAAAAAVEMQNAVVAANAERPPGQQVAVGIGINCGSGIVQSDDVFGNVVNMASRLQSVSGPQQIVLSEAVKQQLEADAPFKIRYLGKFVLRGRDENHDLYELAWNNQQSTPAISTADRAADGGDFTMVPKLKLQCLGTDAAVQAEFDFIGDQLSFGRSQGDLTFSTDLAMAPLHGRVSVRGSQAFVEECGDGPIFYTVGAYPLNESDVIRLGTQLFEFHVDARPRSPGDETRSNNPAEVAGEPASAVAELVSIGDRSKHYSVDQEQTTFGRVKGTYIFPDDHLMSGTHARIYRRGENYFLEDLGSRNGTYVRVCGKAPIAPGTVIFAGGQFLKLSLG